MGEAGDEKDNTVSPPSLLPNSSLSPPGEGFFLKDVFILFYMFRHFACMHVNVPCACKALRARRGR